MTGDNATWLALTIGVVAVTWLPHLIFSAYRWRAERSFRSFRGFFVAVMLEIGLLRSVAVAALTAAPGFAWLDGVLLVLTVLLTAMLFSGGVVLTATWYVERRRRGHA